MDTKYFPSIEAIEKASEVLEEILEPTPFKKNDNLSDQYQANVYLKREDLQMVRSYKIRGAYNMIRSLSAESQSLYKLYRRIISLSVEEEAFAKGLFYDLMYVNYSNDDFDANRCYVFARSYENSVCLVVCNFSESDRCVGVNVPEHMLEFFGIVPGIYSSQDLVNNKRNIKLTWK